MPCTLERPGRKLAKLSAAAELSAVQADPDHARKEVTSPVTNPVATSESIAGATQVNTMAELQSSRKNEWPIHAKDVPFTRQPQPHLVHSWQPVQHIVDDGNLQHGSLLNTVLITATCMGSRGNEQGS